MLVAGKWELCDDGITRPMVRAQVLASGGVLHAEDFLIDCAADRTVFRASLLSQLCLPASAPKGVGLRGVGGKSDHVLVTTMLEFENEAGTPVRVRGEFAGFTDFEATDMSILGRDVLDNFDVIIGRQHGEIRFLAPRHRYVIQGP